MDTAEGPHATHDQFKYVMHWQVTSFGHAESDVPC